MTSTLFRNICYFDPCFAVRRGHVLVTGDRISRIVPAELRAPEADFVVEGAELLAAPGFVNAHFHSQTTLSLGMTHQERATEMETEMARKTLETTFTDWVDEDGPQEDFDTLCQQSYLELLRNGVTTTQDSGYGERPPDSLQRALERVGMRGVLDAYSKIAEWREAATTLISYGGHLPEEEDLVEQLDDCAAMMRDLSVRLFTHSLETVERRKIAFEAFGRSPITVLEEAGVLDKRTVLFHVVHADANDIARISRCGAHVVHCPVSNCRLGVGIASTAAMIKAGINVALGTDWAFANPWENMRLAWYLANAQGAHIPARRLWQMATRAGARALDLNTGEIAVGRLADIMLLDVSRDELQPLLERDDFSTTVHNLLLEGDGRLVRDVMVGGTWVLRAGRSTRVNEKVLADRYREISEKLYRRGATEGRM